MGKRQSIIITALFCGFLLFMFAGVFMTSDKTFSPIENRYYHELPGLNAEAVLDGTFMNGVEDYVSDHVIFRDFWVRIKAGAEKLSGKKENGGVYFAEGGTLIKKFEEPDSEKIEKDASFIKKFAGGAGVPVYFALIPTAADVWSDKLPVNAPTADEAALIAKLYAESGCETVDISAALARHRDEAIFYRTDHHWTSLGAFYGANAIFEKLGAEPIDENALEKETVTEDFCGTNWSSAAAWWIKPDTIERFIPEDGLEMISVAAGKEEKRSIYAPEKLSEKDKYAYFLGGNQPLGIIKSGNGGEKLLLIRDSYADTLAPFLAQRFSEVHLFDLRYNRASVAEYIKRNDIDRVLIIYGLSSFAESSEMAFLNK